MTIEINEVIKSSDLKDFLNLTDAVYSNDSSYVAPLRMHLKMMMGKIGTASKHFLVAYKDQKPVARVGFKTHRHGDKSRLHFGFFECLEGHADAVAALFAWARQKYPDLSIMGPFQFRMEDPYPGCLIEGFEKQPYFLMTYNPPYYGEYLERAGLKLAMDLFTYQVDNHGAENLPAMIQENSKKAANSGITIRWMSPKKLREEAFAISRIFNDALRNNWEFEEFENDQINEMVTLLKLFIDARMVAFAQHQGRDVGCLLMIPNYNPILKGSNGRVTPRLVWNYFRRYSLIKEIRGYALGVLKTHHGMGIGSLLTQAMFQRGTEVGYMKGEISWVLANNGPMNELSTAMGARHNKVYRVFEHKPPANH